MPARNLLGNIKNLPQEKNLVEKSKTWTQGGIFRRIGYNNK